jgi:hypothetical protein
LGKGVWEDLFIKEFLDVLYYSEEKAMPAKPVLEVLGRGAGSQKKEPLDSASSAE